MYRIKDWDTVFENNRTREMQKMRWVPIPNDFDGYGYSLMMKHPKGPEIYGAWIACVNLASKCEPRGTLLRDAKTPHNAQSIALVTRIPIKTVILMLEFCSTQCNWLLPLELPEGAVLPQPPAGLSREGVTEGKEGIEGKEKKGTRRFAPPSVDEVAAYCSERKNNINAQAFVDHYASKGWVVGKSPMKDWRAAVRTWENRNKNQPPATTGAEYERL
jgi:hypothetical protein